MREFGSCWKKMRRGVAVAIILVSLGTGVAACSGDEGYLPENFSEENLQSVDTVNEQSFDIDYGNNASGEVPTEGGGLTES